MIRALITVGIASVAVNKGAGLARSVLVGMLNAAAGVVLVGAAAVLCLPVLPLFSTESGAARRD